ncbi:MAG: GNAT family N-acetyltransferase [Bacteriovoracaceae bacterium]
MPSLKIITTLEAKHLTLMPLNKMHIGDLAHNLFSPQTFFVQKRGLSTISLLEERLLETVKNQSDSRLCIVALDRNSQKLCAMSTFLNPSNDWTRIEIGFTWISEEFQRTHVNAEMKYLMLKFAFENMHMKRVEFSVDPENSKSIEAMKRLGASYEGTLRKWRFNSATDKGNRSIFSILDDVEWPLVKKDLEKRLAL